MGGPDVPLEVIPLHPVAAGANDVERAFARLEQEILHHVFQADPGWAIFRGLHAYDGYLPLITPEETGIWVRGSQELLVQLASFDREKLSRARQLDLNILRLRLERELFYQVDFPSPDLSPLHYLFPIQLTEFVSRNYASADRRAEAVVRQLAETPRFLRIGIERLRGPLPQPFVTLGLDILKGLPPHFEGAVAFVRENAPHLGAPALESKGKALEALHAFRGHLETQLPRADNSYRLCPHRFQKLLRVTDGLTMSWKDLLLEGQADLRRNQDRLASLARSVRPPTTAAGLVGSLAEDTPSAETLMEEARGMVAELREFVVAKDLASLPMDDPCRVEESPPADRAFAFASMRSAGPFEDGNAEAAYRLTLPDPDASSEEQRQWLRSLNRPRLRNTTAHEVFPGHYLQFLWTRRSHTSPTQKAFPSGTFSEGWGHYAEQLVIEQGYRKDDPRQEAAQLQDALLRDCRLLASIAMHAQGKDLPEATQIFVTEGHMEPFPAEREARRGTFNPSYFMYTLGKLRILEARRAFFERNPKGTLRQFHDRLLSQGAPPVGLLRAIALGEEFPGGSPSGS